MTPPILALIIGINKYATEEYPDLSGAVADADAFEDFLKQKLGASEANITNLRDEAASRKGILEAFTSLRDNPKYQKDEAAVIIFYAGHGAQVDKPEEWEDWVTSSGKIEILCPSDIGSTASDEEVVPGIPDRTISTILEHISDIKGSNITFVLDCCSSGGINRGGDDLEWDGHDNYIARQIESPPPIKPAVDERIWSRGSRGGPPAEGWSGRSHSSHVLLAACGRDQFAMEDPRIKRGLFTSTLLKTLESEDIFGLTYTSLMHKMKMPTWQTPHCEGQNIGWRLFNSQEAGADDSLVLTKREKGGSLVLQAGEAQGITRGSRFAVHAKNLVDTPIYPNPCLGYVNVTSVGPFSATLAPADGNPTFSPPRLCYSKLVQATTRRLSIYCDDKPWLESVFPQEVQEQLSVGFAESIDSCDLQLTTMDGKVYFDRHNTLVTPHIGSRIRHTVNMADVTAIRDVAKKSLHFYYHLTRAGPDNFKNVWMELKALKVQPTENFDFDQVFVPFGQNLIENNPATVFADDEVYLGMTIFNQTDLTLYPYLFYFDPTDLTIIEWYRPPFGAGQGSQTTKVDAPLPPKSKFSAGYGDGGVNPWQFVLPEGDTKDLGFFKLFLSTQPAYFESILQESPFPSFGSARGGKPTAPEPLNEQRWATQLVTVIQVEKK